MNLKCSKCGSTEFESWFESTLMGGPINYHTYTCAQCGNRERVKRVDKWYGKTEVRLGEEDEVMKKGDY